MQPAFGLQQIHDLAPIFSDLARTLKDKWAEQLSPSNKTAEVDVSSWMMRTALDAIGLAGFAYDFESLDNDRNVMNRAFSSML